MFVKKGKFLKSDKSQLWKITGIFFAGMVLFTLLSRAAYQHGTAVVNTEAPKSGVIAHNVRITGKTVQNQETAVTTVGGLRIGGVFINEGQQVHAGEVLFTLDPEYLAQAILDQKMEMEKQKLSIQGTWSQGAARQKQRENQQAQAEENYAIAVGKAETTLERAGKNLERAQKALENFYNGVNQEETLHQALEQAKADYAAAQTAFAQLQEEIEARVREAVEQAQQQSTQPLPTEPEPLPTEPEPLPTEPEPLPTEPEPLPTEPEPLPTEPEPLPTQTESIPTETEPLTTQTEPIPIETDPLPAQTEPVSPETSPSAAEAPPVPAQDMLFRAEPGIRLVFLSEITPPDLAAVEAAVREQYAPRLAEAQAEAERARAAVEAAQAELDSCQSGAAPTEQELLKALEAAQEGYDDALTALNNAKTTYGRAVTSAGLPDGGDNSARIGQIKYDQMALTLEELEALQAAEGAILSPMDGIVTACNVQTGQKTTDTTAVLLADLSRGCKFTGVATQEQSKYIGVGDKVTLRFDSTGKEYKDLPVTTFSSTGEKEGGFRLTVQLPADLAALGAGAELRFTRRSQPYNCCVPLSALHLDAKNQAYVLVVEPAATVLGTQMQARKVPVTVLEQNETMAALADGTLHQEQQVIISSDRAVDSGSRVRVA